MWVTINEPNLYAVLAYLLGAFPPGEKSIGKSIEAARNLILAHAAAYHAIHEIQPHALVGLAHHYRGSWPANPRNPLDRLAAKARWTMVNNLVPRALADGRFRAMGWNERLPQAAGTQDFFGLNYYTVERIAFDPGRPETAFTRGFFPEGSDLSPAGSIANEPEGFWEALQWARKARLPIYVTENGVEDATDRLRPRYLAAHIRQLWRAVNFAWPVRGYFCWSLIDNFEWERGWTQRFGLWELIPETQERRKRPSADFYREICRANALSSDVVAAYAPEAVEWLFPPKGHMRPEPPPA
jgi:beta-glucosidase